MTKKSIVYSIRIPIESRAYRWLLSVEERGDNVSQALRELINQYLATYGEDGYARLLALERASNRLQALEYEYLPEQVVENFRSWYRTKDDESKLPAGRPPRRGGSMNWYRKGRD